MALFWYDSTDDLAALRNHLELRGIALGNNLAARSPDLVLTDNLLELLTLLNDTVTSDKDVVYAFIVDADTNVLVHTFDQGFPGNLLRNNQIPAGEPHHVQVFQTENDRIYDVAVPILDGKAGIVRLGMSESSIQTTYADHIRNFALLTGLILVLGLSLAYGLSSILTTPIARLSEAARAIGSGNFKWKAPIWAKDEIGVLGLAFNEMSDELKRKEEMREQLLAKVISAQEEERKRIARELHDETSQALTALMVGLRFAEDLTDHNMFKEKAAELRALTVQTLENIHHLATGLRPSLLDDMGLVIAIQTYVKEYSTNMNIKVDSQVSGYTGQRFSPEIEITIYRIVQEALTNVAKYAEASNVGVILRYRDSSLVAIIEDDGKGFDVKRINNSTEIINLGIFGMYERASLIGGRLTIESGPRKGTTIFLEVPLVPE